MSNTTVNSEANECAQATLSTKLQRSRFQRLITWPGTIVLACYTWLCCLHRRKAQLLVSHSLRYSGMSFRLLCLGCATQLVCFKIVGPSYRLDWLMSLTVSAILLNMAFWVWMQIDLYYQAWCTLKSTL